MNRSSLLWTLVAFFGAGLLFNAVHTVTEDESDGVRVAAQIVSLVVLVGAVVLVGRLLRNRG